MKTLTQKPKKLVKALMLTAALSMPAAAIATMNADWNPVASERLVSMPAKFMDATIEKDFQRSPLANGMNALDSQIQMQVSRMQELKLALSETSGEQAVELRHQFLEAKSSYLDLMNEKHQLNERALQKKSALYQNVLDKLQRKKAKAQDPATAAVIANQKAARERLARSMEQVDLLMADSIPGQPSKYQKEYGENLAKMAQLKEAIARHAANESPMVGNQAMTREEYVRYLLANLDSEQALLDQERLMIGYMAKLVALDAQALEHEITHGELDQQAEQAKEKVRLANTADLFMN